MRQTSKLCLEVAQCVCVGSIGGTGDVTCNITMINVLKAHAFYEKSSFVDGYALISTRASEGMKKF